MTLRAFLLSIFYFLLACGDSGSGPDGGMYDCDSNSCANTEFLNPDVKYGMILDKRDNQVYRTVKIGNQTWMAQNLNYRYDQKPENAKDGDSSTYCVSLATADHCFAFGHMYLWSAAMDSAAQFSTDGAGCGNGGVCNRKEPVRGICPEGWHLPSRAEFETLFETVGGVENAGRALKSASGWYKDGNGNDKYGFSVAPAGYIYTTGLIGYTNKGAFFWSSSDNEDVALSPSIFGPAFTYDEDDVDLGGFVSPTFKYSIRCIKN